MKIHRNFKLQPTLNKKLKQEAAKNNRTETAVVEMALAEWFKFKRE